MKKYILSILFIFLVSHLFAANFFRIGSAGLNWSNVGSWSSTSGGASNGSAQPTSSDNVTFDSNSPATVTVAGTAVCNTLTLNKTSLVITLNGGSLTASSTTTITLGATINKTASETVTLTGIAVNNINGLSGTAKVILTGGTWTQSGSSPINSDLDLQGNITLSGSVMYSTGTISYISGTITVTGSTLAFQGSCTINLSGVTWNNITFNNSGQTGTLTSSLACSGLLTVNAPWTINKTASETVTISGGITVNANSLSGTAKVILTGGTWTGSVVNAIASDLDLQGNITIATNVAYKTGTMTYVSGTITTTSSTLNLTGSCTLNTNGINWNNVTVTSATGTYTINSLLTVMGTFTLGTGTAVTFAGTAGFTTPTLTSAVTSAQTITLKNSVSYAVTSALTCFTSRNGSTLLFTSDDGTLTAALNLTNGASCNVLADFTRITSNGRTINTFNGTVTGCTNVRSFHDLQTIGY